MKFTNLDNQAIRVRQVTLLNSKLSIGTGSIGGTPPAVSVTLPRISRTWT